MIGLTITAIVTLVIFGLIFGSFVNALVWRFHEQDEVRDQIDALLSKKKRKVADAAKLKALQAKLQALSMSKGRSMCSQCGHPLAAIDLVPLFSWLSLRGKCRYCGRAIEDTPLLEAGLPLAFVSSFVWWPMPLSDYGLLAFIAWLIFLTAFAALMAYDFRWYLLPDRIVWPMVSLAAAQVIVHATVFGGGTDVLWNALWGVVTASGIFWLLYLVSNGRWIGFGDVKLGIVLGLLVGGPLQGLMVIFLASLLGSLASIPLLINRKSQQASIIPFGPFLIIATCIVVLFGQRLVDAFNSYLVL